MKNPATKLAFAALLATALPLSAAFAQGSQPIRIGSLMPMTGPASGVGVTHTIGSGMAVKEINAAGGIMGRQIQIITADDQGDPTQAVSEAKRLVFQEKVDLLLGPLLSGLVIATAPVLTEAKIASIHSGASTAITTQLLPYGFSMFTSVDEQAKSMVNYAANAKVKSAAILTDNGALSKAVHEPMREGLKARGITLTGLQEHDMRSTDITPQILALRRTNPDIILYIVTTGEDAGLAVKTLNDIGWDVPIVSPTFSNVTGPVLKIAGPDVFKGGKVIGQTYKTYTYCPGDAVGGSAFAKFLAKLKTAEPVNYERIGLLNVSWLYDGVYIYKAAIEGTKSTEGPKVAAWIEDNVAKLNDRISGRLAASKTSHFLIGADALEMVSRSDVRREDGMVQRAGC